MRIKQIRGLLNLNQSEFATKIGIARSAVSEFENGTREPSKAFLLAIKDLGISLDWFFTGKGSPFPISVQAVSAQEALDNVLVSMSEENEKNTQVQEILPSKEGNYHYPNKQGTLPNDVTNGTSSRNDSLKQSVSNSFESLVLESTAPRFAELEEKISTQDKKIEERLNNLQAQIDELKGAVEKKQIEEVRESAPTYGIEEPSEPEETEELPLAVNLAAGVPVEACDINETYPVPKKLIPNAGKKYCVAKINGTSMTEAGIPDGSYVLLEYTDQPVNGKNMVVKYGSNTTLKLLHQTEQGSWELLYCDGSGAKIELKNGDWEVKGKFITVLPKKRQ